jgi:hypothetical protein
MSYAQPSCIRCYAPRAGGVGMICNACRTIETLEKVQQSTVVVPTSYTKEVVLNRRERLEELKEIYDAQRMYDLYKAISELPDAIKAPPKPEPTNWGEVIWGILGGVFFCGLAWLFFF